ncbi:hypothetical protein [Lentzea sp.]|uniref:hypothetical protein n=1 Tax=Lentzea sp. TaxID=56099 RepID=UPI002ED07E38
MGEDFVVDWTYQSVSINADMDVRTAADIVAERLGIELTEQMGRDGHVRFAGPDASGTELSVSTNTPMIYDFMSEKEKQDVLEATGPEPTSIYVHGTSVGHAIVEALSGPGFRLMFLSPHPEEWWQRSQAGWKRVLPELRRQGWDAELDSPASPVALEGHLPSGEEFYLRCRWNTCTLYIDDEEVEEAELEGEFSASYILPDDAVAVLLKLHQEWLTR